MNTKTHALMFGWEYPPVSLGGLGVACQGLVEGLIYNHVRVTLTLPHDKAQNIPGLQTVSPSLTSVEQVLETIAIPSLLQPYDSVESFEKRIQTYHAQKQNLSDIYGSNLGEAVQFYTHTAINTTKDVKADIAHAHDWMTYGAGIAAARHHDIPLVAHIHATELDRTHFQPNEWIFSLEKQGFDAADAIIAVSNYTKQILVDYYNIDASKITVVHNGINPEKHKYTNTELLEQSYKPMILFLGRLSLQKGAMHFLEMAKLVKDKEPDTQFVIAGAGDMFGSLIDRSIELGLEDNILFAGKVDSKEASMLYKKATAFVMPSLSEPFGLVALEAALHDTPVILSKQSGASEVLDHCFTVDFWDTERMADCALTIIRDEAIRTQMIEKSRDTLNNLHWNKQAHKVKQLYHNLV
jgi:glycogen synthase